MFKNIKLIPILHYSLLRAFLNKKRSQKRLEVLSNYKSMCGVIVFMFFIMLALRPQDLKNYYDHHDVSLAPIVKGVLFLLLPLFISLGYGKPPKKNYQNLRKVVTYKSIHSKFWGVVYFIFWHLLFISMLLIGIYKLSKANNFYAAINMG